MYQTHIGIDTAYTRIAKDKNTQICIKESSINAICKKRKLPMDIADILLKTAVRDVDKFISDILDIINDTIDDATSLINQRQADSLIRIFAFRHMGVDGNHKIESIMSKPNGTLHDKYSHIYAIKIKYEGGLANSCSIELRELQPENFHQNEFN